MSHISCIIPGCRQFTPASEAFCAHHRPDKKSEAGISSDPSQGGLERERNRPPVPASGDGETIYFSGYAEVVAAAIMELILGDVK